MYSLGDILKLLEKNVGMKSVSKMPFFTVKVYLHTKSSPAVIQILQEYLQIFLSVTMSQTENSLLSHIC